MNSTSVRHCLLAAAIAVACLPCLAASARAQIVFDKPKPVEPLPSPYTVSATRDKILQTASEVLKRCGFPFNEKIERLIPLGDKLVTEQIVFAKGVNTRTDLEHYANPPASDARRLPRARVRLEIVALPLDEQRSQLQIIAHFQGLSADVAGGGANEKWVDAPSNGLLEDQVLRALAGKITGVDLSVEGNGRRRILGCEF
jgi:hypothetical protein